MSRIQIIGHIAGTLNNVGGAIGLRPGIDKGPIDSGTDAFAFSVSIGVGIGAGLLGGPWVGFLASELTNQVLTKTFDHFFHDTNPETSAEISPDASPTGSNGLPNTAPPSQGFRNPTDNQSDNNHNDNPTGPTGPTGNPNNGPPSTGFAPPGVTADEPASTPSQSWRDSLNNNNNQGGDGPGEGNSGTAGNNVGSGGMAGPAGGTGFFPIVLDLDGDGIELTSLADSNAFYDFGEAGDYQHTGWVGADDALLAVDLNDDGIIEGKFELAFAEWGIFAIEENDVTAHDFNNDGVVDLQDFDTDDNGIISDLEGLRYFDSNKDGVIDQNDSIWDSLRVWQDSDGDGISDDGELSGLTAVDGLEGAGVKSISLTSDQNEQKIEGNIVYGIGTFLTTTGETLELGDVAFAGSGLSYELGDDAISWLEDGETFFESYQLDDDGETFEADVTGGHTVAVKWKNSAHFSFLNL